ncbi:MAG: hypothetical protein KDB04_18775 [Acidimicrobiales bacterium]|nr:hypothetical protein [Acidimicrobiales bacterium]
MTRVEDYVEGDAGRISKVAHEVSSLGQDFGDAAQELRSVSSTKEAARWYGAAADQFEEAIKELPHDLDLMSSAHDEVGDALRRYAQTLEQLQRKAREAIDRMEVQRREREASGRRADAARARLRALTLELAQAKGAESSTWAAAQAAHLAPMVPGAAQAQQAHESARRWVSNVSSQRSACEGDLRGHERTHDDADREVRRYESMLDGYRDERNDAERACADTIRDALPKELKNPAWYEKAGNWLVDQVKNIGELLDALGDLAKSLAEGNWSEALVNLRRVTKALTKALDFVALLLVVGALAVTVVTGGAGLPLAAGMLQAAATLNKISKGVKLVTLGLSVTMCVAGTKVNGRRAVTPGEALADGLDYGLSKLTSKGEKMLPFKNHLQIGTKGAMNFTKFSGSSSGQAIIAAGKAMTRDDFAKKVLAPHLVKHVVGIPIRTRIRDEITETPKDLIDHLRRDPYEGVDRDIPVESIVAGTGASGAGRRAREASDR